MRIDAHQHFWVYNPREYGWIDETMVPLRRNFLARARPGEKWLLMDQIFKLETNHCLQVSQ
jgi:L-fuconolactonase